MFVGLKAPPSASCVAVTIAQPGTARARFSFFLSLKISLLFTLILSFLNRRGRHGPPSKCIPAVSSSGYEQGANAHNALEKQTIGILGRESARISKLPGECPSVPQFLRLLT